MISSTDLIFAVIGHMRAYKGLHILVEAVEGLGGEWQLIVAGSPD
ncbi:MAG TPA: hypothetical protein VKV31_00015 [bacterium]|nr:hypothetical protein [bacterium]